MASITPVSALTLAALAQRRPQFVDWGIRLDRAPACVWLGLQAAALAPTAIWMACALRSGWGELQCLLAFAVLAFFVWRTRRELRASPRLGWLSLGTLASLSAALLHTGITGLPPMPPWAIGLLATGSLVCSLRAFLPQRTALAPLAGLVMLAFPLLSALKVGAASSLLTLPSEAFRWMRLPVLDVARDGHSFLIDGAQLLWLVCFTACAVALWAGRRRASVSLKGKVHVARTV